MDGWMDGWMNRRTNRIFVNKEPEQTIGETVAGQLKGRFGWLRIAADGSLLENQILETTSFVYDGVERVSDASPSIYQGTIVRIDAENPLRVVVQTNLEQFPESLLGSYFIWSGPGW